MDFDNTQNLYIEGDNLEVLKLLQYTYLNKVKMIYIDPPYNTGKDFVYKDNFSKSTEEYLQTNNTYDDEGNRLVINTESNGRFHTDWLNMMYPRLKLARDLLSDDGVIFISIDDNEVDNLKKVCDEIFGESNFVSFINWKGRGGRQDSKYYAVIHEYILVFAKNINAFKAGEEIKEAEIYPYFDNNNNRYYKRQLLRKWGSNSRREDRPNLFYSIKAPDGTEIFPMLSEQEEGCWRWGKERMSTAIKDNLVEFIEKNNTFIPYEKIYQPLEGEEKTKKYVTWIDSIGTGTSELKSLFGSAIFDYSKSDDLIIHFLKMAGLAKTDIVLDFFSGSATTAHAVMQLNAEDGGSRKFVMVQIPEKTDEKSEAFKAGYRNICEIGKERIRRAGAKIKEEAGLNAEKLDTGFRVLKVDSSNMKDIYYSPSELDPQVLDNLVDPIKEGRTAEDLLFQVMLDLGVLLSSDIEVDIIAGKKIFKVEGNFLIACFDEQITDDVITAIAKQEPAYAVFRDSSLASDSVAINFEQIFKRYAPDTERRVL